VVVENCPAKKGDKRAITSEPLKSNLYVAGYESRILFIESERLIKRDFFQIPG
jgi:hypothetical protein